MKKRKKRKMEQLELFDFKHKEINELELKAKIILALIEQGFEVKFGIEDLDRMIEEYQNEFVFVDEEDEENKKD